MVTILFGAGASFPFYKNHLSTQYLTQQVKLEDNWRKMLRIYNQYNVDGYDIPDIESVISLLKSSVCSCLNFEQLAEIVDKISSLGYDAIPCNNVFNRIAAYLKIYYPHRSQSQYIPFIFREIIANAILYSEENERVDDYDSMQKLQQDFLRNISDHNEKVSVVSLNYDDCIPTSIDRLGCFEYCFDYNQDIYKNMLNIKNFFAKTKVVYFPHGHLRFIFNDKENVSYEANIQMADKRRWSGIHNRGTQVITTTPFCYDFNTFITTGMTKDNALNNMPYAVYYQKLASDFLSSELVILVGYSFNDPHFNRLLKSFLHKNETNKVIIVTKYSEQITLTDEYKDENNLITKISFVFGPEWGIFVTSTGEKLPVNKDGVKKINEEGFSEIFKNVFLYKNGYEEFLKEQEKILAAVK